MNTYLVVSVKHRLDGRTIISARDFIKRRTIRLNQHTSDLMYPVCAGQCYMMKISYATGSPHLLFARRVDYRHEALSTLLEHKFLEIDFPLPQSVKKQIIEAGSALAAWLNTRDIHEEHPPISDPYATLIWCETDSYFEKHALLEGLMQRGLPLPQAEIYYDYYGSDALSTIDNSTLAVLFNVPPLCTTTEEMNLYKLIKWLEAESHAGRTLLTTSSIPTAHRASIEYGIKQRWIRRIEHDIQLTSHALLQARLRRVFERFTESFFPTYGEAEISFAYSRLMSLQSNMGNLDMYDLLAQLVNQRVASVFHCSTLANVAIEQYSALIQTLHRDAPKIALFSRHKVLRWSTTLPYEELEVFHSVSEEPSAEGNIHIVADFELYTVSDLVGLLERIRHSSQLILMIHSAMARYVASRLFIHSQVVTYFATFNLAPPVAVSRKPPTVVKADILQRMRNGLRIITDDDTFLREINALISVSGHPKLVTPEGSYRKGQPVLFEPPGRRTWDSFIGVILSTTDSGLTIEVEGCVRQLSNEFVRASRTSLAYALEVTQAARVGLRRGLLVTQRYHEVGSYLRDLGIEIVDHYSLDEAREESRPPTGQWVMPAVEGEGK